MNRKLFHQMPLVFLIPASIYIASKVNLSLMWGTHKLFLTGISLLLPAFGSILAVAPATMLIVSYYFIKTLIGIHTFTFGIPTALATANWSINYYHKNNTFSAYAKLLLQVVIPLVCMALFVVHPIGHNAAPYSFYWLIPTVLYMYQQFNGGSPFAIALSSTFIAHAVGSVITLYTLQIPASVWMSLIPMVAIERLVFASGTTVAFLMIKKAIAFFIKSSDKAKTKSPVTYLN